MNIDRKTIYFVSCNNKVQDENLGSDREHATSKMKDAVQQIRLAHVSDGSGARRCGKAIRENVL